VTLAFRDLAETLMAVHAAANVHLPRAALKKAQWEIPGQVAELMRRYLP